MKHIVPWQVAMVFVTIGTYVAVLANGGSEQTAVAVAFAVAAVTVVATAAVVVVAFAAVVAAVVAAATAFAAVAVTAVAVVAAVVAVAVVAAVVADDLGIPKRWAFTAYGIEVNAIFGALVTGSVGWALAIGTMGILALLAVWKFGPVGVLAEQRELDRRIASLDM